MKALAWHVGLRELRERSGRSLRELADLVGVSHATVLRWELGVTFPRLDELERLRAAYAYPDVAELVAVLEFFAQHRARGAA